ncbi:MAG: undecaprenyl/decaprenyl-phosphate alpha-N-acetylglucosaminyl 1-phosphate transferase, partial [Anaerolineaceae bacterium]|nr:undecaprenyl/decaprenyl-phosphate alpha-N-acetylglucosaminyl 1-phosphate transferase [Anaerolineaceae bacterium]
LAKKLDIIDYPSRSTHSIHTKPTPRAGGMAIIASILVMTLLNKLWDQVEIIPIILSVLVIFTFGIWDDKKGLNARTKLIGQLIAVTILVYFDVRVKFLEGRNFFIQLNTPIDYWLDVFITYFWVVGITNAYNMVDSMDGLAIGLARIASAFFLFLSIISEQASLVYLCAIIFGINWGVTFFNEYPAKTFLGDSGSQSIGFILAAIAIAYQPQGFNQQSSWFSPIMFFSVPIFDTSLVTISRSLSGLPFYRAHLDHTYHRLIALGWDRNRAVGIMQICAVIFSLAAVCVVYLPSLPANLVFILWLAIFAILIFLLEKTFTRKT